MSQATCPRKRYVHTHCMYLTGTMCSCRLWLYVAASYVRTYMHWSYVTLIWHYFSRRWKYIINWSIAINYTCIQTYVCTYIRTYVCCCIIPSLIPSSSVLHKLLHTILKMAGNDQIKWSLTLCMYVHVHIRMQENPILYVCVCTCVRTYVELTVKS